jgi:hypothetical protein
MVSGMAQETERLEVEREIEEAAVVASILDTQV